MFSIMYLQLMLVSRVTLVTRLPDLRSLTQVKFASHSLCICHSGQQDLCRSVTEAQTRGMGPHCDAHLAEVGEGQTGDYRPLNLCLEVAPITSASLRRPEWVTQPSQLQGRWGWTFTVYLEERVVGYLKTSPNCSVALLCFPVSHDLLNCFHTGINAKSKFI